MKNVIVVTGASSVRRPHWTCSGPLGNRDIHYCAGAFTSGTNHFKNTGSPNDKERAAEYGSGAFKGLADQIQKGLAACVPPDADVAAVADAIVKVVDMPFGKRPFRIHIGPAQDGCEVVNAVSDRIRAEFLCRIGLGDLLAPRVNDD